MANEAEPKWTPPWQPIETAPKDGRFVLLYATDCEAPVTVGAYWKETDRHPSGRFQKGHWDRADFRGWLGMDADTAPAFINPTHWMPLPEPPARGSQ